MSAYSLINKELIETYKEHVKKFGLKDELYKWEMIGKFQGRPKLDSQDFSAAVSAIGYGNLIYPVSLSVIKHIADVKPLEYRDVLSNLFNSNVELNDRIVNYIQGAEDLYLQVRTGPEKNHFQDERTIASILAFYDPSKYALFKDSFYQKYCKKLGIKAKGKNEKYSHYLELLKNLKVDIADDIELNKIIGSLIPAEYYQDENLNLLTQDILYQTLDVIPKLGGVVALMAADNTGWQDSVIQESKKNEFCILWNSKRPSGTSKTIKYLREIVDNEDSFNFYYFTKGKVRYKATVIDFVENQKELEKQDWKSKYSDILYFQSDFEKYKDENKKASIVFLISKLEEIEPLNLNEFEFFDGYDSPRQDNLTPITREPSQVYSINSISSNPIMNPLNQILYGPPGTGKTYNTINKALSIIESKSLNELELEIRDEIKKRYDKYVKSGQIVFSTFHQSMSYEDFIEGIKPIEPDKEGDQVIYRVVDGIFKGICNNARTPSQVSFDQAYERLLEEFKLIEYINLKTPTGKDFAISLNRNNNLSLHTGPEKIKQGTLTKENLLKQLNGEDKFIGWEGYFKGVIEYLYTNHNFKFNNSSTINNYVLIIDEINRGNVSQIFGELITLIEEDKRIGKKEELRVKLPYSKDKEDPFGVPPNLYIIGTMNTADRSVEAMDTALRRRFVFEEMSPDFELLNPYYRLGKLWAYHWKEEPESNRVYWNKWDYLESKVCTLPKFSINKEKYIKLNKSLKPKDHESWVNTKNYEEVFKDMISEGQGGIRLDKMLKRINLRVEKLLGKDYQIGHAFFVNVYTFDELRNVFHQKTIPLLQEYFYGDIGKIALVIGDAFMEKGSTEKVLFNSNLYHEQSIISDMESKVNYKFTEKDSWTENSFIAIYS